MQKTYPYFGTAVMIVVMALCTVPASAVYTHNQTIWAPGGNQHVMELYAGSASNIGYYPDGLSYTIAPSTGSFLLSTIPSPMSMDGVRPDVRYLYVDLSMPPGMNVTSVSVFSGVKQICYKVVKLKGTGTTLTYTIDMGAYHKMNRGITIMMVIQNDKAFAQTVYARGAAAKLEW